MRRVLNGGAQGGDMPVDISNKDLVHDPINPVQHLEKSMQTGVGMSTDILVENGFHLLELWRQQAHLYKVFAAVIPGERYHGAGM